MTFRPIDPSKPIVLAVDNMTEIGFVYIDQHLFTGAEAGMRNYSTYKTDDFIVDCQRGDITRNDQKYWSVTSKRMTFVYGKAHFPNTWHVQDCDLLCAFVAGELTGNQLRMRAYLTECEATKEERRTDHIQRLATKLQEVACAEKTACQNLSFAKQRYDSLVSRVKSSVRGSFSFIGRAKVLKAIEDNN